MVQPGSKGHLEEVEKDFLNTCHFSPADGGLSCTVSWWVIDNLKPTLVAAVAMVARLEDRKLLYVIEADAAPRPGRGSRSWSCWLQLNTL